MRRMLEIEGNIRRGPTRRQWSLEDLCDPSPFARRTFWNFPMPILRICSKRSCFACVGEGKRKEETSGMSERKERV